MKLSKKLTIVTPFSKYLAMVLFILFPFVGFYLGVKYQEIKYNTDKIVNYQVLDPLQQAIEVVTQFENYQKARDGRKVMSLFTPPGNKAEKDWYDFIMGLDNGGIPRLFTTAGLGNYVLFSYQIASMTQSEKTISVEVKETRRLWSNVTATYSDPEVETKIVEVTRSNNKFLIERYYLGENSDKIGKYDGILY